MGFPREPETDRETVERSHRGPPSSPLEATLRGVGHSPFLARGSTETPAYLDETSDPPLPTPGVVPAYRLAKAGKTTV